MYNLFVSGHCEAWEEGPFTIEISRCVREYTEAEITKAYGDLDKKAAIELKTFPCIFAYETSCKKPPKFGVIIDIAKSLGKVRVKYDIKEIEPFLTEYDLQEMAFDLDINKWELTRTHWAVKDVDLTIKLKERHIDIPLVGQKISRLVNISTHNFKVALSFPGEIRPLVESIASEIEKIFGPNSCFYDYNYQAQLARPSLDVLLEDIYRNRSKLIVVFLSSNYQRKEWCGLEFRVIKEIMMKREHDRILFIRTDYGEVDGILKTDGYIDSQKYSYAQIARFIQERLELLG